MRAVAVIAVVLFHADLFWARGGYLGVDLFFVISGFLITSLLTTEFDSLRTIDFASFYWRRIRRLVPAVVLLIAVVTVVANQLAPDALARLPGDSLGGLLFVANWELLSTQISYFETMGRPPLLQHLWSLGIEEQFYLAWPLVLVLGFRNLGGQRRKRLAILALLFASISAAWMAYLAIELGWPTSDRDPTRIYFGTDSHCFGLLLGAALGLMWRPNSRWARASALRNWIGYLGGFLLLGALLYQMSAVGEHSEWLYPWGFVLASVNAAALIAVATWRRSKFGALLDWVPLRWIGERSYGIYLWHWPIFMLSRPGLDVEGNPRLILLGQLVLTLVAAGLSYRWVESPLRHNFRSRWPAALVLMTLSIALVAPVLQVALVRDQGASSEIAQSPAGAPEARVDDGGRPAVESAQAAIVAQTSAADSGRNSAPAGRAGSRHHASDSGTNSRRQAVQGASADGGAPSPAVAGATEINGHPVGAAVPSAYAQGANDGESQARNALELASKPSAEVETYRFRPAGPYTGQVVTALGDSVLLGSSPLLRSMLAGTRVYATTGWQAADIITQLQELAADKHITPVVVIHLGTNGYVTEGQLRSMLKMLSGCQRVVLVNTRVPRRWMEPNNELIEKVSREYPNVVLANWRDVSADKPKYFISDGVHPNEIGQVALIAEIMRAGNLVSAVHAPSLTEEALPEEAIHVPPIADQAESLDRLAAGEVPDWFWRRLALCETGAAWQRRGTYSGGFGLTAETWQAWGGTEFAATPDEASEEQQIVVAKRIAIRGWDGPNGTSKPIGFSGWRCSTTIDRAASNYALVFSRESVIEQSFQLGERGDVVRDLEAIIGMPRDGVYSARVRRRHLAWLKANHLPLERAGQESPVPLARVD